MTEREAWLEMASLWQGRLTSSNGKVFIRSGKYCDYWGLCHAIDDFANTYRITFTIATKMLGKIPEERDDMNYCWPRTRAGARQRAAFCRQQAALCKRKRAKKAVAKGRGK